MAITKAVAPITGGINTPPVEAQASTPPANERLMPMRRMAGIESTPVVSTLLITLPLMEPIRPLEKIDTLAGPPRTWPKSAKAKLMKNLPPPLFCSTTPNTRKPITRPANACSGTPMMLSVLMVWYIAVSGRLEGNAWMGPGTISATKG